MEQIWKSIPNFNGLYEVSNIGNVRRTGRQTIRKDGNVYNYLPRQVKITLNNVGYYICNLTDRKGKSKAYSVQMLVYMAFKGEIPKGYVIDHIDENKTNNNVENLQLLTYYDNTIKSMDKSKTTSKYIGVHKKKSGKYTAAIYRDGKRRHLGTFINEEDAGQAYIDAYNEYENSKKS